MLRGLGNRVDQALNSVTRGRQHGRDESGSWPTSKAREAGFSSVAAEPRPEDLEPGASIFGPVDTHDTIPSPPPELDSAPWQDER